MANYDEKKAKREKERMRAQRTSVPRWMLAPLIAVLAIIPLITYYYRYDTNLQDFDWYIGSTESVDFFLYYKMVFLLIACGCMILFLAYQWFMNERKPLYIKMLIPLAVYAVLSLLSAFLSDNSYFSFHGIYEQFESVWVLLGYCIIVYYAFLLLRSEDSIRVTMKWFTGSILVLSALGISQAFSCDFLRTDFAKKLITPSSENIENLGFKFEEGRSYLTLYNPNYIGYYAVLVIPILVALLFSAKKSWHRIAYGVLTITTLFVLFSSQSRAGFLALIFSIVVMLFFLRKQLLKKWKLFSGILVLAIAAFFTFNAINQNVFLNRLKTMFSSEEDYFTLESIETLEDRVTITYNGERISFCELTDANGTNGIIVFDENEQSIAYTYDESAGMFQCTDERFPFYFRLFENEDACGFLVQIDGHDWLFTNRMKENDTTYYALAGENKCIKLKRQETGNGYLDTHYSFANMRGYIWAKTLPLLKEYFWFGCGPDTFVTAFPNDDLVGIYNANQSFAIITKPHSLYLQIAVQTGVPSLIAFLLFFGWYLISSFRFYWKRDFSGYLPKFGIAAMISVIGYLFMGFTNDSCITVAPIFFCIAGMGLGINHKLKEDAK